MAAWIDGKKSDNLSFAAQPDEKMLICFDRGAFA